MLVIAGIVISRIQPPQSPAVPAGGGSQQQTKDTPAPAATASRTVKDEHESCIAKATPLYAILVVTSDMRRNPPRIVVREREWNKLSWEQREAFADVLNCAVAGPGKTLWNLEYYGDRSLRTLAVWKGSRLQFP